MRLLVCAVLLSMAPLHCFGENPSLYYPELISNILNGTYTRFIKNSKTKPGVSLNRFGTTAIMVLYSEAVKDQCGEFLSMSASLSQAKAGIGVELGALKLLGSQETPEQVKLLDSVLSKMSKRIERDVDTYVQSRGGCKSRSIYDFQDAIEDFFVNL